MSTSTLQQLANALGVPTPADVAAVFDSADANRFAARGRRVASDRVITDTSRLYGLASAFWAKADPDQRDLLVGFSDALLGVAVHVALTLEQRLAAFQAGQQHDHTVREVTAAELGDAWTKAMRRRDLAVKALAVVAGDDPGREARLAGATGTAEGAEALARGLSELAALARTWIADPGLARIVRLTRMDAPWIARLDAASVELRDAAAAARTRMSVQVAQGDLDELDGRNLYVLKIIVDVFDEAHDIDPTIPRLIPIAVARSFGGKRKKGAEGDVDESDADADDNGANGTDAEDADAGAA